MRVNYVRMLLPWLLWLFISITASSCMMADQYADPNEMLQQALDRISTKGNFVFDGEVEIRLAGASLGQKQLFTGQVVNQNKLVMMTDAVTDHSRAVISDNQEGRRERLLYVKSSDGWVRENGTNRKPFELLQMWNPLIELEHMSGVKSDVIINRELSNQELVVLDIQMDPQAMKTFITAGFARQHHDAVKRMTQVKEQALREELDKVMIEGQVGLKEMLQTLTPQTQCRLWIDRKTGLPNKLEVNSKLNFVSKQQSREETTTATYLFKSYDEHLIIP